MAIGNIVTAKPAAIPLVLITLDSKTAWASPVAALVYYSGRMQSRNSANPIDDG
jgi:hypothetical protein